MTVNANDLSSRQAPRRGPAEASEQLGGPNDGLTDEAVWSGSAGHGPPEGHRECGPTVRLVPSRRRRVIPRQVRDAQLPASDQPVAVISDLDQPQLLGTPAVDRRADRSERAVPGRAQEVGAVGDPDHPAALAEPDRSSPARNGLDDRAQHAAVDDAVRLQMLRADLDARRHAVSADLGHLDADVPVEPADLDHREQTYRAVASQPYAAGTFPA